MKTAEPQKYVKFYFEDGFISCDILLTDLRKDQTGIIKYRSDLNLKENEPFFILLIDFEDSFKVEGITIENAKKCITIFK